jgi:biotin carboxyl carrier protein
MNATLRIIGVLLVGAALGAAAARLLARPEAPQPVESHEKAESHESEEAASRVHLDAAAIANLGIRAEAIAPLTRRRESAAQGLFIDDPSSGATLRAPLPGIVSAESRPWPKVGDSLAAGAVVGSLAPRLSPLEIADLRARQVAAASEARAAESELAGARVALERARKLNADDKNISDRALRDAETRVGALEAKRDGSVELAALLEGFLAGRRAETIALRAPAAGEVVELWVVPGESVEAGQPVLRTARFDRLLARVDLPAGAPALATAASARIVVSGSLALPATRVALAPSVKGGPGFGSLVFECDLASAGPLARTLRPGTAFVAYLPETEEREGFAIPAAAIVRNLGSSFVYVARGENDFERRPIDPNEPFDGMVFATSGFAAGDRVVVSGAGLLLAEERKASAPADSEGK